MRGQLPFRGIRAVARFAARKLHEIRSTQAKRRVPAPTTLCRSDSKIGRLRREAARLLRSRFRNKMSTSDDSFENFLKIYNETIVLQLASQVTATAVDELCSATSDCSVVIKCLLIVNMAEGMELRFDPF